MRDERLPEVHLEQGVLKLLKVLRFNTKAYTARLLAKAADVRPEVVDFFMNAIERLSYLTLKKSASGRLISFEFNPWSKDVMYADLSCIINRGRLVYGEYRSRAEYYRDRYFQEQVEDLKDCARRDGVLFVYCSIDDVQLCGEILKCAAVEPSPAKAFSIEFPLVSKRLEELHRQMAELREELKTQERKDEEALKWFETETAKARAGQRCKVVRERGRFIGMRTIFGPAFRTKDSAWDGGNEWWTSASAEVADFEIIERTIPDYPDKPERDESGYRARQEALRHLELACKDLIDFAIKWESKLRAEELTRANGIGFDILPA